MSAIEALTNAVIGLCVSWSLTYLALPLWGLQPTVAESGGITAMFFFASFFRAWAVRVAFKKLGER